MLGWQGADFYGLSDEVGINGIQDDIRGKKQDCAEHRVSYDRLSFADFPGIAACHEPEKSAIDYHDENGQSDDAERPREDIVYESAEITRSGRGKWRRGTKLRIVAALINGYFLTRKNGIRIGTRLFTEG